MIIEHVSQLGEEVISARAQEVNDPTSPETQQVVKDLIDSNRHYHLVGMAAPQIGVSVRIFVTEIRPTQTRPLQEVDDVRVFINPEIIARSEELEVLYNGCGSVAESGLFGPVERPQSVTVRAHNERGEAFELVARGLLSHVVQHEIDHLDGITFLEHVSDVRTLMSASAYRDFIQKSS